MIDREAIRRAFYQLHKASGLSREKWAELAEVGEGYPRQLLKVPKPEASRGVGSPTIEQADKLCAALDKTLWDLLEVADPEGAVAFRRRLPENGLILDQEPEEEDVQNAKMVMGGINDIRSGINDIKTLLGEQKTATAETNRKLGDLSEAILTLAESIGGKSDEHPPKRNSRNKAA